MQQPLRSVSVTVVGGGLAGSFAAAALVAAGAHVNHWHFPQPGQASTAAAGLFNVITGAQPSLTWRAQGLVSTLLATFEQPLLQTLAPLLHAEPIVRPLRTGADVNAATALALDHPPLRATVAPPRPELPPHLCTLELHGCGWLDVPAFLQQLPALLAATGRYRLIAEEFDAARALDTISEHEPLVFAQGMGLSAAPQFPARPLQPLAGEVLVLRLPPGLAPLPYVLVGGGYMIARPDGTVLWGSTYEPRRTDPAPTAQARADLLARLAQAWPAAADAEVIEQWVGIRPTTPDRKALIGRLPHRPVWYLGGLGTKGVLQAPSLAQWLVASMVQFVEGQSPDAQPNPWPAEVDLYRRALRP